MRTSLLALGFTIAALAPHAQAETWQITDAHIDFDLNWGRWLTDVNGVWGEAGRRLYVANFTADLDKAAGLSTLTRETDGPPRYESTVHYQLKYTLYDYDTQEVVANISTPMLYQDSGYDIASGDGYQASGGAVGPVGIFQGFSTWRYPFTVTFGDGFPGASSVEIDAGSAIISGELKAEFGGHIFTLAGSKGRLQIVPIPEPETYALMAIGVLSVGWARLRKNKR